jgi:hypothetical protein
MMSGKSIFVSLPEDRNPRGIRGFGPISELSGDIRSAGQPDIRPNPLKTLKSGCPVCPPPIRGIRPWRTSRLKGDCCLSKKRIEKINIMKKQSCLSNRLARISIDRNHDPETFYAIGEQVNA